MSKREQINWQTADPVLLSRIGVEVWRPIPGYNGLYDVSNLGRVRSFHYNKTHYLQPKHRRPEVALCKKGSVKYHRIHRLVLLAFISPRPNGMEGRHLDDVQSNNCLYNLQYGTKADNYADRSRNGTDNAGERNGNARLTVKAVQLIRLSTESASVLAQQYHVTINCIDSIKNRRSWQHVP